MKRAILFNLAALFASSFFAMASPPTRAEIVGGASKTWEGSWDWDKDDGLAENHSKLTIKGDAENGEIAFVYTYAGKDYKLQGQIVQRAGDEVQPAICNLTLPSGDHLRFVWPSMDTVDAEYWPKGKKAGLQKNKPAHALAKLKLVSPGKSTQR